MVRVSPSTAERALSAERLRLKPRFRLEIEPSQGVEMLKLVDQSAYVYRTLESCGCRKVDSCYFTGSTRCSPQSDSQNSMLITMYIKDENVPTHRKSCKLPSTQLHLERCRRERPAPRPLAPLTCEPTHCGFWEWCICPCRHSSRSGRCEPPVLYVS